MIFLPRGYRHDCTAARPVIEVNARADLRRALGHDRQAMPCRSVLLVTRSDTGAVVGHHDANRRGVDHDRQPQCARGRMAGDIGDRLTPDTDQFRRRVRRQSVVRGLGPVHPDVEPVAPTDLIGVGDELSTRIGVVADGRGPDVAATKFVDDPGEIGTDQCYVLVGDTGRGGHGGRILGGHEVVEEVAERDEVLSDAVVQLTRHASTLLSDRILADRLFCAAGDGRGVHEAIVVVHTVSLPYHVA